jgi:hypothetical protein
LEREVPFKSQEIWIQGFITRKFVNSHPKFDESFGHDSDKGKKMLKSAEINEVAFIELILSIDTKSSEGKVAFNLVKGCKSKEYSDSNAAIAWERLRNKFEPVSAPSMVKLEKQCRTLSLKILKYG